MTDLHDFTDEEWEKELERQDKEMEEAGGATEWLVKYGGMTYEEIEEFGKRCHALFLEKMKERQKAMMATNPELAEKLYRTFFKE